MFRVFLHNDNLIVFDKSEKEFRQKYGNQFEQVTIIKDQDNIDSVTEKLKRQYNSKEVIKDCKIKKKFGWSHFSEEIKNKIREYNSIAMTRYKRTEEHGQAISRAKKGKSIKGHPTSEYTKKLIAFKKLGVDPIKGRKWMHNPISGKEKRGYELEEGMIWGRSPEASEYVLHARLIKIRQNKYKKNKEG